MKLDWINVKFVWYSTIFKEIAHTHTCTDRLKCISIGTIKNRIHRQRLNCINSNLPIFLSRFIFFSFKFIYFFRFCFLFVVCWFIYCYCWFYTRRQNSVFLSLKFIFVFFWYLVKQKYLKDKKRTNNETTCRIFIGCDCWCFNRRLCSS